MKAISVGTRDAARMLGVSRSTLYRLTKAGVIRHWRLYGDQGYRFYSVADLEEFVKQRIEHATATEAAVPAESEQLLPQLARTDGYSVSGFEISSRCSSGDRGSAETARQDTDDVAGMRTGQTKARFGQRMQGDS